MNRGTYLEMAEKFRRALRNGTGCKFTPEQTVAFVASDAWPLLAELERQEMLGRYAGEGLTNMQPAEDQVPEEG